MHKARRFAKNRKPEHRTWSLPRRPVLVRRIDVTPEQFAALRDSRKFPARLFKAREEPFRCGTPMLRAAAFVGPPRPSVEDRHKGYPLTNWKRKRLNYLDSFRYMQRRIVKNPRYL